MRRISRLQQAYNSNTTYSLRVNWFLFDEGGKQQLKGLEIPYMVGRQNCDELEEGDSVDLLELAKVTHQNALGSPAPNSCYLNPEFETGYATVVNDYDSGGSGTFDLVLPDGGSFHGEYTFVLNAVDYNDLYL